jgi:CheY-like chemotaxis protein
MKTLERILLVDDDPNTNFYNKIVLDQENSAEEIVVFNDGEDALEYLQKGNGKVDLILLDINMPIMNGWQFLEHYEKLEEEKKAAIVVVMLTSSVNQDDKKRAAQFGLKEKLFNKPLKPETIKEILSLFE